MNGQSLTSFPSWFDWLSSSLSSIDMGWIFWNQRHHFPDKNWSQDRRIGRYGNDCVQSQIDGQNWWNPVPKLVNLTQGEMCESEEMESIEQGVKTANFSSISVNISGNGWKWVPKLVNLTMGEIFESEEMESIEPSIKLTIFPSISVNIGGNGWKLAEMGSKIGQFDHGWNFRIWRNGIDWA